jgi:signal transduction histidine kinase/CheY-like chemotaxis protein
VQEKNLFPTGDLPQAMADVLNRVRDETLIAALPCLFIASIVLLDSTKYQEGVNWRLFTAVSLIFLGIGLSSLRSTSPGKAGWLLVASSFLATYLIMILSQLNLLVFLLVVPVGAASLTSGKHAGVAVALLSSIAILLTPERFIDLPMDLRWTAISVISLTAGMAWLMLNPLLATVEEAIISNKRSLDLLKKTRDAQEHLQRSLVELTNSNNQLIRLNQLAQNLRAIAEEERRAKEQFVANISHELRTPLNMIIGFCEMILKAPEVYGKDISITLLSDLDVVLRNSQHLSGLIDDILDLSQIDTGRLALVKEPVQLGDLIQDAVISVQSLFQTKQLFLNCHIPDNLPPVYCDPLRIREVMMNLLSNAGRFTEKGGITIHVWRQEQSICASIADTGIGMSREEQQKVFKPFQQADGSIRRKYSGSGLGLSISKSLIELHDGMMWVESEKGKGTTFFFRLPIDTDSTILNSAARWINVYQTQADHEPLPQYRSKGGKKMPPLMVTEQGTVLQKMLKRYLRDVDVISAPTFDEALQSVEQMHSRALIVNHDSRDGALQERLLKDQLPFNIPVIACSVPELEDVNKTLGVHSYLVKPIARETLLQVLAELPKPASRILVVDDDQEAQRLIKRMLSTSDKGYQIFKASDGAQALDILCRSSVNAILLDLTMPNMNGYKFLEMKRQMAELAEIPVILVTARDPFGHPIMSRTLTVALEGGLSAQRVIQCIEALMAILAPVETPVGAKQPKTFPG